MEFSSAEENPNRKNIIKQVIEREFFILALTIRILKSL
jgi:hypothetical protein